MSVLFQKADVIRQTGATAIDVAYWIRVGAIVRDSDSGYSVLNVIEVAQAVELKRVHIVAERIKLLLAAQRARLAALPAKYRAAAAWTNYVRMIRQNAETFGETLTPAYRKWEAEVETVLRRLEKKPVATDYQVLELLAAQHERRGKGRAHAEE